MILISRAPPIRKFGARIGLVLELGELREIYDTLPHNFHVECGHLAKRNFLFTHIDTR